ncbi:hypothetical protein FHR24_001810 [Wenyingzhuangia heitensis]|uniref:Carbohydrate binding domain-containing protein n=1 Tax=Wenyingzhuangia heitensis TaxID=1487859 RepID=A0ABX0U952_9FLAO|nr:hypothetical protein [Wenyingzhuangia heitensis]NIJ45342.1 hypothetical protein [Wenyingzhuangia heitensis]
MKKINKIIPIIITVLLFVGCNNEEVEALSDLSDATWTISEGRSNATEDSDIDYSKNVYEFISFIDLSQNALSHEWHIAEENKYLKTGFKSKDSLPLFVDNSLGTVSKNKAAHVMFLKSGINDVTIINTFKDSVNFRGSNVISSVRKGDVYEITRTWKVDVYDIIKPEVKISDKNGTVIFNSTVDNVPVKKEDWVTVNVEAGDFLTYEDLSTVGRPNANGWKVSASSEKTAKGKLTNNFTFFKLGEGYDAGVLTAAREGDDIPNAKTDYTIPVKINVVQSSQPFVLADSGIKRISNNVIELGVTGEVKALKEQEGDFTVHVTNGGFDQDINVVKAEVSSLDKTKIHLTLESRLYNTDIATVSYVGKTISSLDERELVEITTEPVKFVGGNILGEDHFGFETGGKEWFIQHPDQWSYSTSFANSGTNSLKFETVTSLMGGNAKVQGTGATNLNIPAATYTYSLKIYIDPNTDLSKLITNFSGPWKPHTWDLSAVAKGEWATLSAEIELGDYDPAAKGKLIFQVNKADISSDNAKFFVDDLSLVEIESRP